MKKINKITVSRNKLQAVEDENVTYYEWSKKMAHVIYKRTKLLLLISIMKSPDIDAARVLSIDLIYCTSFVLAWREEASFLYCGSSLCWLKLIFVVRVCRLLWCNVLLFWMSASKEIVLSYILARNHFHGASLLETHSTTPYFSFALILRKGLGRW